MTAPARSLAELREDAARRNVVIDSSASYTVGELAARWKLSAHTVREIARDELPYLEFGQGLKLRRRRYLRADVEAYEASHRRDRRGRGRP